MESELRIVFADRGERSFHSEIWNWTFHHHSIELRRKDGKKQIIVPEYNVLYYEVNAE